MMSKNFFRQKRRSLVFLTTFLLTLVFSLGLARSISARPVKISISAAISLKSALGEIEKVYIKNQPKVQLTYNFGSSGSLQQQIENGAPVDIFISAAKKQMDALETKKLLLSGTRRSLLTNQIVLVTPKNETFVNGFQDLTNSKVSKIALGENKSVPAGQYGEEVLKFYKILDSIKSKIVYGKDVRQVLTYVETGNVNAGLVYVTDAKTSDKVRVVATAPENSPSPIVYPIAILKDSKNPEAAKAFTQFLVGQTAQAIFKKHGFGTGFVLPIL
jgi:molybdate transport system substrate-binding protein